MGEPSKIIKQEYMFLEERLDEQQKMELSKATQSTCKSERSKTLSNPSG